MNVESPEELPGALREGGQEQEKSSTSGLSSRVQVGLVVSVALLLYLPALGGDFVYDDDVLVLQNGWIRSWRNLGAIFGSHLFGFVENPSGGAYYRPLMQVLLTAIHGLAGGAAWAFHAVSLLLHAGTSLVVWLLGRQLFPAGAWRNWGALAAGLVFAVHPVHVEAVAWISGLMDVATTFFGLLSLALLTRHPSSPRLAMVGAVVWFTALLFKETAVVVPVLLLGWDLAWRRERPRSGIRWRYGALACVALAYGLLRLSALGLKTQSGSHRLLETGELLRSVPLLITEYAQLLLWPVELNVYRAFAPPGSWAAFPVLLGLGILGLLLLFSAWSWRRERRWAVLLLWLGLPLLPVLYLPALGDSAVAERYAYLPSAGFALLAGALVGWGLETGRRRVGALAVLGVTVALPALAARTALHVPVWKDGVSLWTASLEARPGQHIPLYNLGSAYLGLGDLEAAITLLEAAVTEAPGYAPAVGNLAVAYGKAGRPQSAIALLEPAVRRAPENAKYRHNLGLALSKAGRWEEALAHFKQAMELEAGNPDPARELGRALLRLGRSAEAVTQFEEAKRRDPSSDAITRLLERARREAAAGRE